MGSFSDLFEKVAGAVIKHFDFAYSNYSNVTNNTTVRQHPLADSVTE